MKEKLKSFVEQFGMLTPEEVELVVDGTRIKSFKKGTILLEEGQVSKHCYMVLEGLVREYYLVEGEEKSTAFYTQGDPVNSFSSYNNQTPSKHYWVCAEDCVLTVGDQDLERAMCEIIPRLEAIIRQEVEKLSGKGQDEFAQFITSSPEQRYLHLQETRPELLQRVPQHQIASFIGVTPESLSRIRKRLAKTEGTKVTSLK